MFKNLIVYRIGPEWPASAERLEEALGKARFQPCAATQPASAGWVAPRNVEHAPLVESVDGQLVLELRSERKLVPASVVRRRTEEIVRRIEQDTGRKPGRKQTREIKEQALQELLPLAFTRDARIPVWIDPRHRLLAIGTSRQAHADEVASLLVECAQGMALSPLQTRASAVAAMSAWLSGSEPPAGFTVDRECELRSSDEARSVVRYARHPLDIDEVRSHVQAGKSPTRLALTWEGRVSFVLTEAMQLRRLDFLDVVFEGRRQEGADDDFDADVAIVTGELRRLIPDLVEALGGEQQMAA